MYLSLGCDARHFKITRSQTPGSLSERSDGEIQAVMVGRPSSPIETDEKRHGSTRFVAHLVGNQQAEALAPPTPRFRQIVDAASFDGIEQKPPDDLEPAALYVTRHTTLLYRAKHVIL